MVLKVEEPSFIHSRKTAVFLSNSNFRKAQIATVFFPCNGIGMTAKFKHYTAPFRRRPL